MESVLENRHTEVKGSPKNYSPRIIHRQERRNPAGGGIMIQKLLTLTKFLKMTKSTTFE